MSAVGVQLGGIGPMAPNRIPDMSRVAIRALVAGTVACFMTACVAGKDDQRGLYSVCCI